MGNNHEANGSCTNVAKLANRDLGAQNMKLANSHSLLVNSKSRGNGNDLEGHHFTIAICLKTPVVCDLPGLSRLVLGPKAEKYSTGPRTSREPSHRVTR